MAKMSSSMEESLRCKFIPQQLLYFIGGRRCCQQFSCSFRESEQSIIISTAYNLGLRSQYFVSNGQGCVKVFKQSCMHYLEEPKSLALSTTTVREILAFLSRTCNEPSVDYICNWRIKMPVLHMPLAALSTPKQLCPRTEQHGQFLTRSSSNFCHRNILESVYSHRITIFNGHLAVDKSILYPLVILEDAQLKKTNLKIICIERNNIVAEYNSMRFAQFLGENVGETVGIQVPKVCNISSVTHIVYTTAKYFLRSLFGKDVKKLDHISHFVINDIHLHIPYTDILLSELKIALNMNPNLRIILLSQAYDSSRFLNFFGEGHEFCVEKPNQANIRVSYLEDIESSILTANIHKGPEVYKNNVQHLNKSLRSDQTDKCLVAYEELGNGAAFRPLLYMINYELVPVNYQHSFTGKTAIMIASQLTNANHIRLLLFMGANPYIMDSNHENAVTVAFLRGNHECIDILCNFGLHGYVVKKAKPDFVDYDAIINIVYLICTKPNYAPGNILIILPTYYHLVKLNYMLLSHFLTAHLRELAIYLLHDNMAMKYLNALINTQTGTVKVVLTTDIVESLPLPIPFQYLIDTACQRKTLYDSSFNNTEPVYEWVTRDCLLRRLLMLNNRADTEKHCFRLITKDTYEQLESKAKPEMLTMPLDKICLTVKLLSPTMVISEYLSYTISAPPLVNIHQTVQFLKKIDVLDESEDVTWLGCRLIDIPVSCQLGRTIMFALLLQCLDPIVTIVSAMCTDDPLSLPLSENIDSLWHQYTIYIQNRIKEERSRLAGNQVSDHLIILRLFKEWEDRLQNNLPPLYLTDEHEFIVNGLMEQINTKRIKIVSALRAANLIHCQGPLSLQNINLKSNKWPVVKAALTGGLYPNICAVDHKKKGLNSAHADKVFIHPNTVLREFLEPLNVSSQRICTQWMICTKEKNIIKYATIIAPLPLALFAGPNKLGIEQFSEVQTSATETKVHFFIDEWIWMDVSKMDFELVLKLRQQFFKIFQYMLRHCCEPDKWRSDCNMTSQFALLSKTLALVFENEDVAAGFKKCSDISFSSNLKQQNLYLLTINSHFLWRQEVDDKSLILLRDPNFAYTSRSIERQFFVLYTEESPDVFYQIKDPEYIENVIGKFARPIVSPSRHIYLILYTRSPDKMLSISRAKVQKGEFFLKEYFRNTIPVGEVLEICSATNISAPNFNGRLVSSLIDKRVGNLIMDLFAFRHHWIHS